MMAHIYRHGDPEGLHFETNRITLRPQTGLAQDRALIFGTLPNLNTLLFDEIDWFWIEES